MKILFYRYGSICEPDIVDCFKQSGHTVYEITEEITNKNVTFAESVKLVDESLNIAPYDCVFTVNFFPAISDLCNIYHIRYICWIVDSPVLELFSKSITNKWNRVFLFDREQYNDIHPLNPSCVFHYPLAVDVNKKQNAIKNALTSGSASKYCADISFVGSLYSEKSPFDNLRKTSDYLTGFLEGLIESQLRVYGYYFVDTLLNARIIDEFRSSMPNYYEYKLDNFLTDKIIISQYYIGNKITSVERSRIIKLISEKFPIDVYTGSDMSGYPSAHNRGLCKTETEMPIIFHESTININPTSKAIRSGIPLRVFDLFACEGFMISNYQPELCELFTPGEDFVYYDNLEQLPETIDYYLNHKKEAREIAHNAFIKVSDNFTYLQRLNWLLLTAFEV